MLVYITQAQRICTQFSTILRPVTTDGRSSIGRTEAAEVTEHTNTPFFNTDCLFYLSHIALLTRKMSPDLTVPHKVNRVNELASSTRNWIAEILHLELLACLPPIPVTGLWKLTRIEYRQKTSVISRSPHSL